MNYTNKSLFLTHYIDEDNIVWEDDKLLTFKEIAKRLGLEWSDCRGLESTSYTMVEPFNEVKFLYDVINTPGSLFVVNEDYRVYPRATCHIRTEEDTKYYKEHPYCYTQSSYYNIIKKGKYFWVYKGEAEGSSYPISYTDGDLKWHITSTLTFDDNIKDKKKETIGERFVKRHKEQLK